MAEKALTKCYLGILFSLMVFGCSYAVSTKISPAVNVYSSYEEKIPGNVALVVNDNAKNIHIDVTPSSHVCSAHKFPIDLRDTLATSIKQTAENVFNNVIELQNIPSKNEMELKKISGTMFISLKRFDPSITFFRGFWEGSVVATCEIVLEIMVSDFNNKKIITTTVGGSRTSKGSAGSGGTGCSGGAEVLSDAISKAIQDTMEKLAEIVSNSKNIRDSFYKT